MVTFTNQYPDTDIDYGGGVNDLCIDPDQFAAAANLDNAIPDGGTNGQLLAKVSNDDGDVGWVDPAVYSMSAATIDTDELYRIIMFSDGTVRAIPITAVEPSVPTGLANTPKISSVRLTWVAGALATSYIIYRDGVQLATTTNLRYRDATVTVGETYEYTVQSVSAYLLRSGLSTETTAFIDPALNQAPTVEIRTWPATIAVGNKAIIRVNAIDLDGQALALALNTDVGSLTATADPSVWLLDPV